MSSSLLRCLAAQKWDRAGGGRGGVLPRDVGGPRSVEADFKGLVATDVWMLNQHVVYSH